MAQRSIPFSLTAEIDGMTVRDMIEMLNGFPQDAVIRIRETQVYGYGGWTDERELNMSIDYTE